MGGIYSLSSCQGRGQRLIDIIILILKPPLLLLLKIMHFELFSLGRENPTPNLLQLQSQLFFNNNN